MSEFEYISGREFTIGDHQVHVGDTVPEEFVNQIPYVDAYVTAGYLYRVVPETGYDRLPPHVYNIVVTRPEAEAQIAGDPGITSVIDAAQEVGAVGDATVVAERQAELAVEHAEARKLRRRVPTAEEKASAVEVTKKKGK